jgi:hypothetical protein
VFHTPNDRASVEQQLQALNVHPEEVRRPADLGDLPETIGNALVTAIRQGQLATWLTNDVDDPQYRTSDINQPSAIALERTIASGIGTSGGVSPYERLFVGGTPADAPLDADVVHVNVLTEDMRFPALGPRILIDGKTLPLPDRFFRISEGYHIPLDRTLTPALVKELHRTIRVNGLLLYAPSSNVNDVEQLLIQEGFVNVRILRPAPRTVYRGRITLPTMILQATRT